MRRRNFPATSEFDTEENLRPPSKSQLKRDAQESLVLSDTLLELSEAELNRCPLRADTRNAILFYQTMKHGPALKRQKRLVAKLIRSDNIEEIEAYLASKFTPPATAPFHSPADSATCLSPLPPPANLTKSGHGPEVIFMHGWTGAAEDFDPIFNRFESQATCIRWDARPYYSKQTSIARLAADLHNVIQSECQSKPFLLGHSMGALVAFEYVQRYGQDQLSGLIIVDMTPCMLTQPGWPLALYGNYTAEDNQQFIDELNDSFVDRVCALILSGKKTTAPLEKAMRRMDFSQVRENRLNKLNPTHWITCWQDFVVKDYRPLVTKLTLPALLLFGEKSNFYGPPVAHYLHQSIPHSTRVLFPNAGHSPHVEQPDRFTEELVKFIQSTPSRRTNR